MKKIKEIYYLDKREDRDGYYSDHFLYILEDGTKIYTQSTDMVAHKIIKPTPSQEEDKIL